MQSTVLDGDRSADAVVLAPESAKALASGRLRTKIWAALSTLGNIPNRVAIDRRRSRHMEDRNVSYNSGSFGAAGISAIVTAHAVPRPMQLGRQLKHDHL